ncbi:hypothetical protein EST38_g8604 [Candolleomyces aberdarensis]|uniref:Nephrocystin 3-like N-terminal domain-containing protein n=1 Tax=Candolleomyces aberdarensis TaxID=2316362 RepID=A0A4Q2DC29_9AGAR|nr:hypothetical protein EST38_g8604 [Candolleomyces aberdarensis]
MAAAIPQTEPFIREAVRRNPALLSPPGEAVSLQDRMQCLVYEPFKALDGQKKRVWAQTQGPFLMVLDGLDECNDKDEVQELIDGMLAFFNNNPLIPLRVFITSRVEEHIQSRLGVPAVRLDNLVDHCSDDDIATFLDILFEDAGKRNSVIRAYVRQHGQWPTKSDRRELVEHIGGSFIFASAVFKFIMAVNTEANDPRTPMDRLPLALKMNPGLDGLYAQTLARSQHLPHFSDIISTIALLFEPFSTSAIAELLGIHIYEVVNVLVNLQAIIQVPGTDDIPVTLCHTSLRDFLTTQSRSGDFFAHPSHHVRLLLRFLECKLKYLQQDLGLFVDSGKKIPAIADYDDDYFYGHKGGYFKPSDYSSAIHLCRKIIALQPGNPGPIEALASVLWDRARDIGPLTDWDEAISLHHEALKLQPYPHPKRSDSLEILGGILLDRHRHTGAMVDLEGAISMHREVVELRPPLHPFRPNSLNELGNVLLDRHEHTRSTADLEEAISLFREAVQLHPDPDPGRGNSLRHLGNALVKRHWRTGTLADLEEAIAVHREALDCLPSPIPVRSYLLRRLVTSLWAMYGETRALFHLQEAITHCEELLAVYYPVGHRDRSDYLDDLISLLQMRFDATGQEEDLAKITTLKEEADRLQFDIQGLRHNCTNVGCLQGGHAVVSCL